MKRYALAFILSVAFLAVLGLCSKFKTPAKAAEPDQSSFLTKIREAETIAKNEYEEFQKLLLLLSEVRSELRQLGRLPTEKQDRRIRERIQELKSTIPGLEQIQKKRQDKSLALVLNQEDGSIQEIFFQEEEKKRRLSMQEFRTYTEGCSVTKVGGNGHNANLLVQCENHIFPVLALVHFHATSKELPHYYVPYSYQIHTSEVVAAGKKYLDELILDALAELAQKKVPSKAFEEEFVHWKFSKEFVRMILISEHMDHDEFAEASLGETFQYPDAEAKKLVRELVEKVYVILGSNREQAYVFSVSRSNACCLAQFIHSTYRGTKKSGGIVQAYPEAGLEKDFFKAMRNHKTAVQAMVLLFDRDLSEFSSKSKGLCGVSKELLEDCLAAAYNGGVHRLNRVIEKHGKTWDQAVSKKRICKRDPYNFCKETIVYLKKIRAIRQIEN